MSDLAELKAAIAAAIEQHGTISKAERALGLYHDSLRNVHRGHSLNPGPKIYRALGLTPPETAGMRLSTQKLPAVVRAWQTAGLRLNVVGIAQQAGCTCKAVLSYLESLGLTPDRVVRYRDGRDIPSDFKRHVAATRDEIDRRRSAAMTPKRESNDWLRQLERDVWRELSTRREWWTTPA